MPSPASAGESYRDPNVGVSMQVRYLVTGIAFLAAASVSRAQSAADHVALGDQLHAQLKPAEALVHYRDALAVDSNSYDALIGVTRDAIDLGEFEPDKAKQKALYDEGLAAARRAAVLKPDEADPHFFVARALGRVALSLGKKDRVR
jgi:tetratricopeptide (TPR) repeat protein